MKFITALLAASLLTLSSNASEIQKVTSIDIYVSNFYSANGGKPDYVNVYGEINDLLMANDVASLKKAIAIVESNPAMVAPSTLMVLSARAYDLGLRDEAAFWFYNGKNRYITFADIIDMSDPKFQTTKDVNLAFIKLVGDVINPYAFCDIAKQREIFARSVQWVKEHPYEAIFLDRFASKFSDKKAALKKSESLLDETMVKQDKYFADPKNLADFKQIRRENNTDERFCW